jgi:hypothetical protein
MQWLSAWSGTWMRQSGMPWTLARPLLRTREWLLITAVALAALVTGLTSAVAPGTITGAGAGRCLLAPAAITLIDKRLYTGLPTGTR